MAGGYKSYTAQWLGGASAPADTVGGYNSLLAFWIGGASSYVEPIVVDPPSGGGGGWYAPRREPPRPPKKRQPVDYSVNVGCDTAKVSEGGVSFAIQRSGEIAGTDKTIASTGSVAFAISRSVRVGRSAAAVVIGECFAKIVRKPQPKKRLPVFYSAHIDSGLSLEVRENGISFTTGRTVGIESEDLWTASSSATVSISRSVRIDGLAFAAAASHCEAAIARDPIPERPLDTRLASAFARRAVPLDIDSLVLATRREARRISADLESGAIGAADWAKRMRALTRSAHVASAAVGRGGIDAMRAGDWRRVDAEIEAAQTQIEATAKLARVRCFAVVASRSRRLADSIRTSHDAAKHAFRTESAA